MPSIHSPSWPPAVVLGLGVNGLGVTRSLGQKGIFVVGVYQRAEEVGRWSRYCRAIRFPALTPSRRTFLDHLLRLGSPTERPALFPTSDEYLQFVSDYREELATHFRFAMPDPKLLEMILRKNGTQELAERQGFPIPKTRRPTDDRAVEGLCRELTFPCLIKPLDTFTVAFPQQAKNAVVQTPDDLRAFYRRHPYCAGHTIVQEIIRGGDGFIFVCAAYLDARSRPLAVYTGRKIRQYPPDYGITCLGESVYLPELETMTIEFLGRIGYRGVVGVEYARDRATGAFFLLEINARSSYYNRLPTDCGVNLPYTAYRDWLGEPAEPRARQCEGVRWLDFGHDLSSCRAKRRRGEISWREWFRAAARARSFAYYDPRDLKPFWYALAFFVGAALKKMLGRTA